MSDPYGPAAATVSESPYTYWIADTLGGEIRATPPLADVSFGWVFNGTGTFSGKIAAHHPDAPKIVPLQRCLYVTRGQLCVWGGLIWTAGQSAGSKVVDIAAAEFGSFFARKKLKVDLSFSDDDKLTVADALIDHAQATHPDADLGIVTSSTTSGVTTDQNYLGTDRATYLDLVTNLANTQNGYRFEFPVVLSEAGFERRFVARYPAARRLTLRIDERLFAQSPGLTEDATDYARRFDALGEGEGSARLERYAVDTRANGVFPMLDADEVFSSISSPSVLEQRARERLARSSTPRRVPTFPLTTGPGAELGSYRPGDEVFLEYDFGWRSFSGWQRIAAMTVTPAGAAETIAVSFVDPSNFEVT